MDRAAAHRGSRYHHAGRVALAAQHHLHEHALGQGRPIAGPDLLERPVHRHHHAHGAGLRVHIVAEAHELGLPFGHMVAQVQAHQGLQADQPGQLFIQPGEIQLEFRAAEEEPAQGGHGHLGLDLHPRDVVPLEQVLTDADILIRLDAEFGHAQGKGCPDLRAFEITPGPVRVGLLNAALGGDQRQGIAHRLHGRIRVEHDALGLVDAALGGRTLLDQLALAHHILAGQRQVPLLDGQRGAGVLLLHLQLRQLRACLLQRQLVVGRIDANQQRALGQDLPVPQLGVYLDHPPGNLGNGGPDTGGPNRTITLRRRDQVQQPGFDDADHPCRLPPFRRCGRLFAGIHPDQYQ